MEKRTFMGLIEAGEPLIKQAIDAMREYHDAQAAGLPDAEIERLHLLAESLFQAVSDYQLRVMAKARAEVFRLSTRPYDRHCPAFGQKRSPVRAGF